MNDLRQQVLSALLDILTAVQDTADNTITYPEGLDEVRLTFLHMVNLTRQEPSIATMVAVEIQEELDL